MVTIPYVFTSDFLTNVVRFFSNINRLRIHLIISEENTKRDLHENTLRSNN